MSIHKSMNKICHINTNENETSLSFMHFITYIQDT